MMRLSAGDVGPQIDFSGNEPGDVLQRLDGEGWQDYKPDGKPITNLFDIETLEPGRYRLRLS